MSSYFNEIIHIVLLFFPAALCNKVCFTALYTYMKRIFFVLIIFLSVFSVCSAQDRTVQNRPYTDLRPLHFGVVVGTHLQDIELVNAGPQLITSDDGTQTETLVTTDQDRWDAGFNVGVLAELRLNTHFQVRLMPAMYFGTRHITFRDLKTMDSDGTPHREQQEMKTAYISTALDLIFAAPRFNNHRPYLMAGINPMINLSGKSSDLLRLKRYGVFAEVGVGCDFYLPFFKLRPELKFLYGIGNSLDGNHVNEIRDKNSLRYVRSVKEAHTKMIVLSFYFE